MHDVGLLLWTALIASGLHLVVVVVLALMLRAARLRRRILRLEHTLRTIRHLTRQLGDADLLYHVDDLLAAVTLDAYETT